MSIHSRFPKAPQRRERFLNLAELRHHAVAPENVPQPAEPQAAHSVDETGNDNAPGEENLSGGRMA